MYAVARGHQPDRKRCGTVAVAAWTAAGVTFLLFVLYPLSIGPAEWLWRHGFIPDAIQPFVRTIYAPLVWLAELCPPIGEFLRQCIRFWNA